MNTTEQEWFAKLERSWKRLCEDFARREFFPVSENDITCYLYHSLVAREGLALNSVHTEYPVYGGKEVDIVLGRIPLEREAANTSLFVQIKLRKRRLDYYLYHYKNIAERAFFGDDVEKLIKFKGIGSGVAVAFFQKLPPSPTYKEKSEDETLRYWKELETSMIELEEKLKKEGVKLLYGPLLQFYKRG